MVAIGGVSRQLPRWTILLALAISGPAAAVTDPDRPPPGSSHDFEIGYMHGCANGYSDAGRDGYQTEHPRDDSLYAASLDYRRGFELGEKTCYEYERAHPHLRIR